jgi:hypothetical protein
LHLPSKDHPTIQCETEQSGAPTANRVSFGTASEGCKTPRRDAAVPVAGSRRAQGPRGMVETDQNRKFHGYSLSGPQIQPAFQRRRAVVLRTFPGFTDELGNPTPCMVQRIWEGVWVPDMGMGERKPSGACYTGIRKTFFENTAGTAREIPWYPLSERTNISVGSGGSGIWKSKSPTLY